MFDLGWTELLVIGVVALIVVGPKDLPGMFRQLGKFTAKARSMAREFQRSMEDAAEEAGVSELQADLRKATSVSNLGLDGVEQAARDFAKSGLDPSSDAKKDDVSEKIANAGAHTKELAKKRSDRRVAALKSAQARKAAKKEPAETAPEAKKPASPKKAAKKPPAKKPAPGKAAPAAKAKPKPKAKAATKPKAKAKP